MSEITKITGKKIRRLRNDLGLSQEKLAEKANLDYRSIGAAERGERNLSLESLVRVAKALNVNLDTLLPVAEKYKGKSERESLMRELEERLEHVELSTLRFLINISKQILNEITIR